MTWTKVDIPSFLGLYGAVNTDRWVIITEEQENNADLGTFYEENIDEKCNFLAFQKPYLTN